MGSKDDNATFAAAQLQMERSSFGINRTGDRGAVCNAGDRKCRPFTRGSSSDDVSPAPVQDRPHSPSTGWRQMLRDFRGDVQKCGSEDAFYRNVAIAGARSWRFGDLDFMKIRRTGQSVL